MGPDGENMLQAITRHTNSQNAVREKDFLALTSDFRTWASQMAERFGVFLEIQRGGWDSRLALQKQRPDVRQFAAHANAFDLLKVYGAGWLGEAGTAFGRNAAFLPNGSIFKRILNRDDGDEMFGVGDLYAAYRLSVGAEKYEFGRKASQNSRRQTRFLFFMVVVELLKDILLRAQLAATPSQITKAMLRLFEPGNEETASALLDAAIEVIGEYLTAGEEDCVFVEPSFLNTFNNDLNGYLKWEQLAKTEESSPHLRALIGAHRRTMGRASGGQVSPREQITQAIRNGGE